MTHRSTNRSIAVLTVAALVLVSVATATPVAASDDPPSVPASFHGEVYVDGEPAPAGTEIVALIDGDERGAIVTDDGGQYGAATIGGEKLTVGGDDGDEGAEITFQVDGEAASETSTWKPGTNEELRLTVGEPPAELPDDGNDSDEDNDGDDTDDDAGGGGFPSAPGDGGDGEDDAESGEETAEAAGAGDADDEDGADDDGDGENADGTDDTDGSDDTDDSDDESESDGVDDADDDADDGETGDDDDAADDGMPAFGVVGALAGLLLIAALAGRRP